MDTLELVEELKSFITHLLKQDKQEDKDGPELERQDPRELDDNEEETR